MMYRILSFDGGGIRGVLTARILERLEQACPGFINRAQLFAGTSTGAILAVALAKGVSPADLVRLYIEQGKVIFSDDPVRQVMDGGGLIGAKYSTDDRFQGIYPTIGDITLYDLLPKHVLICTFDLADRGDLQPVRHWKARFFHNYLPQTGQQSESAIDLIMRSTAAPTYFPIVDGFIDGGVVAGDPCMCALAQALNADTGNQPLADIIVLSLGTGTKPQYLDCLNDDWGLLQWGSRIVDLLLDASNGLAGYQCNQLLGPRRYLRINPLLPAPIRLDDTDAITQLLQVADAVDLSDTVAWLQANWL